MSAGPPAPDPATREELLARWRAFRDFVLPWIVVAAATAVVNSLFVTHPDQLGHMVRYAFLAAIVGMGFAVGYKHGVSPQLAFSVTVGVGLGDEVVRTFFMGGARLSFLRPLLAMLGATWGMLPWIMIERMREADPGPGKPLPRAAAALACLLLPLLLLDPVTVGEVLGHYPSGWVELHLDTPVLVPGPRLGVPLLLGGFLLLGHLLSIRAQGIGQPALLAVLLLVVVAVDPPSRKAGTPLNAAVPHARANRAPAPVVVDGVLEPAWNHAQRLGPFVHNTSGAAVEQQHVTYARVLWDEQAIYFAFEVHDPDVWARDTPRDDPWLPSDEVVEVFLDDGGDGQAYFELEVSPKNVVQDLFITFPPAPVEHDPRLPFRAMNAWDARGLQTAVKVAGTLDVRPLGEAGAVVDTDRGYVVELMLPWKAIEPFPSWREGVPHRPVPPRAGDRWRLGLFRTEIPRPPGVNAKEARKACQYQSWAPTGEASFHVPRRFGVLVFAGDG